MFGSQMLRPELNTPAWDHTAAFAPPAFPRYFNPSSTMPPLIIRNKLALGYALAVAVIADVLFALWSSEPRSEGKPLSYWLDQLPTLVVSSSGQAGIGNLQYVSYSNRPKPAEAPSLFESHSPPASPSNLELFPYLDEFRPSPVVFRPFAPQSADHVFSSFLLPPDPQRSLKFQLSNRSIEPRHSRALFAVLAVGHKSLPTLLHRLQARDKDDAITRAVRAMRQWAIKQHLMRAGPAPPPPDVRRGQAALAIVRLGDIAKPLLPAIVRLAKAHPDPGVRASALDVLRCLASADYAQITGQTNAFSASAH